MSRTNVDLIESRFPISNQIQGGLFRRYAVFSREERERHVWIVGKSGSSKSTVLFNLAMADIVAGEGVAVVDPHGDLADDILDAIPRSRANDVCYLDAGETDYPVGLNPATRIATERRALAASGIVSTFKHL